MKTFSTLIILLLLSYLNTSAQWTQVPGPEGIWPLCFANVNNQIWLGGYDGIYISSDQGVSWSKSNLPCENCGGIVTTGDSIFYTSIIDDDSKVVLYRSFDGAKTWQALEANIEAATPEIVEDKLFMSGNNESYISNDFGTTWTVIDSLFGGQASLAFYNQNLIIASVFTLHDTTGNSVLYISTDATQTWKKLDTNVNQIYYFYNQDSTIISLQYNGEIWTSQDMGTTWKMTYNEGTKVSSTGFTIQTVGFVNENDTIYAYYPFSDSALISINNGNSWQITYHVPKKLTIFQLGIDVGANDFLYNNGYNGIYKFYGAADTSLPSETGLYANDILQLKQNNNVFFASSEYGFFKSNDGGFTWQSIFTDSTNAMIKNIITKGDTVIAINMTTPDNTLIYSFDNGNTWTRKKIVVQVNNWIVDKDEIAFMNGKLFAADGDSLKYSTDMGTTWISTPVVPDSCFGEPDIISDPNLLAYRGNFYMVDLGTVLYKYNPTDNLWHGIKAYCTPGVVLNRLFDMGNYMALGGSTLAYSADSGKTWTTPIVQGLTYVPDNLVYTTNAWFCIQNDSSISYSLDYGINWTPIPGTQPFLQPECLALSNNVLYAGTYGDGIWQSAGTFYTLSGQVYNAANSKGIKGVMVQTKPSGFMATTDSLGNYSLLTDATGDSLIAIKPGLYSTISPGYYITSPDSSSDNFAVSLTPGILDNSIDLQNDFPFIPGFHDIISVTIENVGTDTLSLTAKLLPDPLLQVTNSSIAYTQSGDTLIWNLAPLQSFQQYNIQLQVTTSFLAVADSTIKCQAWLYPLKGDTNKTNNYYNLTSTIVDAYDPNSKTCVNGNIYADSNLLNKQFTYIIRFQNTGTYQATNVVITDTLSNFFNWSTFKILSSSNPVSYAMSGQGIVNFYFNNIDLPDSSANELLSHGFVKYGIYPRSATTAGDDINNSAYIYFDHNAPVITDTTSTLIVYPSMIPFSNQLNSVSNIPVEQNYITAYPNPASGLITIEWNDAGGVVYTLDAFDMTGRRVGTETKGTGHIELGVSGLAAGMYLCTLASPDGTAYRFKFIKM